MKTFEEACRATFVKPSNNPGEEHAAFKAIEELASRWQPMIDEIRASSLTRIYLYGTVAAVAKDLMEVDAAFLSVFVSGIIIGAEMYQQQGGIALESVPGRREREEPGEPPPAPGTFNSI